MSATMNELETALRADESLAKQYQEALAQAKDAGASNDAEAIAFAAKAVGYDLPAEEIQKFIADQAELSEDDLEAAVGGIRIFDADVYESTGDDIWCVAQWHCYTAYRHTETENEQVACWSDYRCLAVYQFN